MSDDILKKLHHDYYEYQRNSNIGKYITIAGFVAMIAKIFWHISDSEYIIGAIIGGGGIYWGINQEKFSATKRELNRICQERFSKPYIQAIGDVVSSLSKEARKPWQ